MPAILKIFILPFQHFSLVRVPSSFPIFLPVLKQQTKIPSLDPPLLLKESFGGC